MKCDYTVAITGMNAKPDNPGPGLAVARCLRESDLFGGRIIGLGYDALDPGLYLDDYCDASYLLPYPSAGEDAFLEQLEIVCREQSVSVLIPCLDAELPNIVRLEPRLRELGIRMLIPSAEQLRMRNKDQLPELAAHAGIGCPEIKKLTDARFFHDCEEHGWEFPLVVKGIFYDAYVVHNVDEAVAAFRHIAAQWGFPVLVQKHVKGEEYNLSGLGDGKGNLIAPVMMKKMAVTDKGKAWSGISIDDKKLLAASERLVKAISWTGPLEVEVIKDSRGQYHLIEINPRFPAWIYLSVGAKRNVPLALLLLLQGTPAAFTDYQSGVLFIRYAQEALIPITMFESVIVQGHRQPDENKT